MKIHLKFIGKDSVTYDNDIDVSSEVYNLLQNFIQNKKPSDPLFPHANSTSVNMLLKAIKPNITVKNLRTVKANQEFIDEIKRLFATMPKPKTEIDKIRFMYLANKKVAITLNHQKNIAKNYSDQSQKLKEKIKLTEQKAKETAVKIKENKLKLELQENEFKLVFKNQPDLLKLKLEELKLKKNKLLEREIRVKKGIERAKFMYEKKSGTKDVALGTSLASYLDARIVISICKELDLNPGKIYTKSQLKLFDYALNTDADFWRTL
ncbi:MAG: hypothetical protein LBD41_04980 [Clostridiales Family XIII bacterium]|jgi:hypothetical protein|nr:hypothetical protein [Clostridiales Family XIII bacterium]